MIGKLLGFVLVLTRISAFFLIIPVFGWQSIPARIKVAMTLLISVFFALITPWSIDAGKVSSVGAALLIAYEATYGLALGLVFSVLFAAVKFSGQVIEQEMGLTMAEILDPMTGENSQPVGLLLETVFIVLFLSANGHHLFLAAISRSYQTFPIGAVPTVSVLAGGVIEAGSTMLVMGLKLAAPILAAFLLMMAIFMPFIYSFMSEFTDLVGKLLPV